MGMIVYSRAVYNICTLSYAGEELCMKMTVENAIEMHEEDGRRRPGVSGHSCKFLSYDIRSMREEIVSSKRFTISYASERF